jgi:hypothetical protein
VAEDVYGLRQVPLAAIPWPHNPFRCAHFGRARAIMATYPDTTHACQAATAELFEELTPADFAACLYHRPDWPTIVQVALELVADGIADGTESAQLGPRITSDERLPPDDRTWLWSLLSMEPIEWDDGDLAITNGQHRLCAMRAAGVLACSIQGYHPSATAYPAPLPAIDHAHLTVERFWTTHLARRLGNHSATCRAARLLHRHRGLRRVMPG